MHMHSLLDVFASVAALCVTTQFLCKYGKSVALCVTTETTGCVSLAMFGQFLFLFWGFAPMFGFCFGVSSSCLVICCFFVGFPTTQTPTPLMNDARLSMRIAITASIRLTFKCHLPPTPLNSSAPTCSTCSQSYSGSAAHHYEHLSSSASTHILLQHTSQHLAAALAAAAHLHPRPTSAGPAATMAGMLTC